MCVDTCVELKTCEACGVLYTRPVTTESPNYHPTDKDPSAGTPTPYCARCEAIMKDFPTPGKRGRGRPRKPVEHGTFRQYDRYGCRCPECMTAAKERGRKLYQRKKGKANGKSKSSN
jgi:hypothetical protein